MSRDQIFLHGNLNSGVNEDRADRDAIAVCRLSFLFAFYRQAFLPPTYLVKRARPDGSPELSVVVGRMTR